jgi:hypothetical protein
MKDVTGGREEQGAFQSEGLPFLENEFLLFHNCTSCMNCKHCYI